MKSAQTFCLTLLALLSGAITWAVQAQTVPAPAISRISEVRLYPGGATIERIARVAAGARSITFSCLPASLSLESLQISADAGVRLGDVTAQQSVRSSDTAAPRACPPLAADAERQVLMRRRSAIQAEMEALSLVTGFLKGLPGASTAPVTPQGIAQQAEALKKTALDSELRQAQLREESAELERQLEGPQLQRPSGTTAQRVQTLTISLAAPQPADVRIRYSVQSPGWVPSYRMQLDSGSGLLRVERMAELQQSTGEDWTGVKLVLSTTRPRANATLPRPQPWNLRVVPIEPIAPQSQAFAARAPAPAPAPAPAEIAGRLSADDRSFDVSILAGAYEMEFVVPQPADVPSGGQRMTLALGTTQLQARLLTRTTPLQDPTAYLVAELPQPAGLWPPGIARLIRDDTYTGSIPLRVGGTLPLALPFGVDDRVKVEVKTANDTRGTGGFVGSRLERRIAREYVVTNAHDKPVALEVLEGSPIAKDEQIKVEKSFVPPPAATEWQNQPGVVLWSRPLGPRESASFKADYVIGYPKDMRLLD